MNVEDYLRGQCVFVTGGSGFVGKVLIEKLLRTCPDISRIYVLLRPKSGKTVSDRLRRIVDVELFDQLKRLHPGLLETKIAAIDGDVAQLGLGLSPTDRATLIRDVTVTFHVAASIRFIEHVRNAVLMNIRGTREVCRLALEMRRLQVFQYVSTAYSNLNRKNVGERLYAPHGDWRRFVAIAETGGDEVEIVAAKMLGVLPNTYVFTKSMAEHVVRDLLEDKVPSIVIRPSIVISTAEEPTRGWVDNFNGPVSVMIGGGKGFLRTVYADPNARLDYIPVDDVVKGMIAAVWKKGSERGAEQTKLCVYNASSNRYFSVSMRDNVNVCNNNNERYPFDNQMWYGAMNTSRTAATFWLSFVLQHLTIAVALDAVIYVALRQKPAFVKVLKQIYQAHVALRYYMFNEWNFDNAKFLSLENDCGDAFRYRFTRIEMYEYFEYAAIGFKKYLLREDMQAFDRHKRKSHRMKVLHYAATTLFYACCLCFVYAWTMRN